MSTRRPDAHEVGEQTTAGVLLGGDFSGNAAAVRAGRRLADPVEVDRLVHCEALRYLALKRKTKADRERMRAALVPYLQHAAVRA